jgi:hypothetical protein
VALLGLSAALVAGIVLIGVSIALSVSDRTLGTAQGIGPGADAVSEAPFGSGA